MKIAKVLLSTLGSIVLMLLPAAAQCGDPSSVLLLRANCYTPLCHGIVIVLDAASCSGGSCDYFQNIDVDCCGTVAVTNEDVGACAFAKLHNKRERRQLLALVKQYNLLAPACGGSYVPARSLLKKQ
jgi:hypothetical protein